jgi:hypothetical protein
MRTASARKCVQSAASVRPPCVSPLWPRLRTKVQPGPAAKGCGPLGHQPQLNAFEERAELPAGGNHGHSGDHDARMSTKSSHEDGFLGRIILGKLTGRSECSPCADKKHPTPNPAPSPTMRPARRQGIASVSASIKNKRFPWAARPPAFRTDAIRPYFTRTTQAPALRAIAAVASVDPSSTTMISGRGERGSVPPRTMQSHAAQRSRRGEKRAGLPVYPYRSVSPDPGVDGHIQRTAERVVAYCKTDGYPDRGIPESR